MVFPTAATIAVLSALSSITAIPHLVKNPERHPVPAGGFLSPSIRAHPPSFPIILTPPICNLPIFQAANLTVDIHSVGCYPSSYRTPPITNPSDCGVAVCELLASGQAIAPELWGPRIDDWKWGSCGLFLVPKNPSSYDTFSRLQIAWEAQRVVAQCITEEYEYRGGDVRIGQREEFTLVVKGIREGGERKNVGKLGTHQ